MLLLTTQPHRAGSAGASLHPDTVYDLAAAPCAGRAAVRLRGDSTPPGQIPVSVQCGAPSASRSAPKTMVLRTGSFVADSAENDRSYAADGINPAKGVLYNPLSLSGVAHSDIRASLAAVGPYRRDKCNGRSAPDFVEKGG